MQGSHGLMGLFFFFQELQRFRGASAPSHAPSFKDLSFGASDAKWWQLRRSNGGERSGWDASLGGGFKYFLLPSLPGEMIQFD